MKEFFVRCGEKIRTLVKAHYFPFIVYGALMLVIHMGIELNFGDDTQVFKPVLQAEGSLLGIWLEFLIKRYQTWSSRLVIESVLILVVQSTMLWRVLDTIIMVWIAVAFSLMFNREKRSSVNWFIVCAMFAYPMESMISAGWIASTTNYSWPLAMGMMAMIPISNLVHGKRTGWIVYVMATVGLIYSVNQEQMCGVVLAISAFFLIWIKIRDGVFSKFILAEIVVSFASMVFILTCPGNEERTAYEIIAKFPEFSEMSLFRKLEMGYSSALFEFFTKQNFVFVAFSIVLVVAVILHTKKAGLRWIAAIPFVSGMVMGVFASVFAPVFPYLVSIRESMTKFGTGIELKEVLTWIPDLYITAVAIAILIAIWSVYEEKKQALFPIYLLLVGLASRWVMCFSPTIWASDTRTYIFMYFSVIAVSIMLFRKVTEKNIVETKLYPFVHGFIGFYGVAMLERCLYYLRGL